MERKTMSKSILVVGCGSIGERHAKNLSALGHDLWLFDIDTEKQREVAAATDAMSVDSVSEGIEHDPDCVFVCTPSDKHVGPAQQAAEAGCDLFIEKPLSNNADGVLQLLDTIERNDIVSMIGCNYRFHPAMRTVKTLLDDNAVGHVVSARIETGSYLPDWHPWEDYREMYSAKEGIGGVLLDAIHGINYGRWFFGDERLVTAMLNYDSSLEIETEDTASLIVKYRNSVQCEFHFDYIQRTPIRAGHITGEQGSIRWGGTEKTVRQYDVERETWTVAQDYSDFDINDMYVEMAKHFIECTKTRSATTSPVSDGWKDLQLVLAAKQSYENGRHIEV